MTRNDQLLLTHLRSKLPNSAIVCFLDIERFWSMQLCSYAANKLRMFAVKLFRVCRVLQIVLYTVPDSQPGLELRHVLDDEIFFRQLYIS